MKRCWTCLIWIHSLYNGHGWGFIYIDRWDFVLRQHIESPCCMRLSKSWCVIQHLTRLFWYWYSWWSSWLLTWIWIWIAPGGSARFWDLDSCWPPVDCRHPTWVKSKIPWLGGLSLTRHTYGASFRILSKFSATSLCHMPYFYLANHSFWNSLCGVNYSTLSLWPQLVLTWGQRQ